MTDIAQFGLNIDFAPVNAASAALERLKISAVGVRALAKLSETNGVVP